MKQFRFLAAFVLMAVMAMGLLGTLYALLQYEPHFYRQALHNAPSEGREHESKEFERRAFTLFDQIHNDQEWRAEFSDDQANSWLAVDFLKHPELSEAWTEHFQDPRVVFLPDRVLLAYRTGDRFGSVVSIEAKIWLSSAEPNTMAVEIVRLRAGALPLSLRAVQDRLTENARDLNMEVQWFRNEGNAVALVRFQADKREPTFQLQALQIRDGSLYVKGRSLDPDFPAPRGVSVSKAASE